jgi:hypothetical protein
MAMRVTIRLLWAPEPLLCIINLQQAFTPESTDDDVVSGACGLQAYVLI